MILKKTFQPETTAGLRPLLNCFTLTRIIVVREKIPINGSKDGTILYRVHNCVITIKNPPKCKRETFLYVNVKRKLLIIIRDIIIIKMKYTL